MRTWRSKMGKEALDALRDHFETQKFRKAEVRAKFVRDQLDNCRYLYEDPEKEVRVVPLYLEFPLLTLSQAGVYRAPLLLQVYGYHEGLIEGRTDAWYGNPVGALAFAATAVSVEFV